MSAAPENPKKAYGIVKPSASFSPMNVMPGVWRVFMGGAGKYGKKNWRERPVEISTYYDAAMRHMEEFFERGIDADPESGEHPLDHAIADLMIIRDGILQGSITDDRKKAEVLTRGEVLAKNIAYAGGDVPQTAQPQIQGIEDFQEDSIKKLNDLAKRAQREF